MGTESGNSEKIKVNPNDFLANERTFLAWVRTSLGIMAFGFVIVKFSLFLSQMRLLMGIERFPNSQANQLDQSFSSMIGYVMILLGIVVLFVSYFRYNTIHKHLLRGVFNPSRRIMMYLTIGIILIVVLLLVYLL